MIARLLDAFDDLEGQEADDFRILREHRHEAVVDDVDLVDAALARRLHEAGDQLFTDLLREREARGVGVADPGALGRTLAEGEVADRAASDHVVHDLLALALQEGRELFALAQHVRVERARETAVGGEHDDRGAVDRSGSVVSTWLTFE